MATRTQVYLTDEQRAGLRDRARIRGVPMSELIREAIDTMLAQEDDFDATFGSVHGLADQIPNRDEWDRNGRTPR